MSEHDKPYTVNLHYEDPEDPNSDACAIGCDFASIEEARACVSDFLSGKSAHFNSICYSDIPYIEIDGPGVSEVVRRPKLIAKRKREREADNRAWQHEMAMEAGMGMGVQAYNDVMGYDSEPYDYPDSDY